MKGIKKLFFGLIFLTLFSVGFKIDAKAYTLTLKEPTTPYSWEEDGLMLTAKFTKQEIEKLADGVENDSWDVTCQICKCDSEGEADEAIATATVKLIKYGKNSYDVVGESGENCRIEEQGNLSVLILADKGDVYQDLEDNNWSVKYRAYCDLDGDKYGSPITVKANKVKFDATYNGKPVTSRLGFAPEEPEPDGVNIHVLKGDRRSMVISYDTLGSGIKVSKIDPNLDYDDNPEDSSCTVYAYGKGSDYTAKVTFGVDSDFINIDLYDGHKVGLNCWSKEFQYELYDCSEEDIKVYLNNQLLRDPSSYVMDSGTFRFKAPTSVGTGTKVLKLVRDGGAEQQFKIQVIDRNSIKFTIDDPIVTFEDYSVPVYPTVNSGVKITGFDLDSGSSTCFTTESEVSGSSFTVTGVSQGTGILTVIPHLDVDLYASSDSDDPDWVITSKPKVEVVQAEDLDIDDVYVINGMKIKLSKFVDGYDSSMSSLPVTVTLDSKAKNLISLSKGTLGKIEITGKTSGTREDGISVFLSTADVTVYPKPSISLDSSSTSSSSSSYSNASYKFTAKMPAGDYHDDWMVSSLGTVEFTVISSSGEEKSLKKISSYSSSSSNDSKTRSFTATITAREMADALGKGNDSVKIRAYAYDGDKRDDKVYAEYSLSYNTGSSSSSSSSSSTSGKGGSGGSGSEYDDVPKTGESKTDIWVLWTVLFIAILGAGFMIYKRFGLVRAIAEAEEEVAAAEHEERVEAARKEKEDKINMLKDLRNL